MISKMFIMEVIVALIGSIIFIVFLASCSSRPDHATEKGYIIAKLTTHGNSGIEGPFDTIENCKLARKFLIKENKKDPWYYQISECRKAKEE